jgi:hypothetical protein
MERAVGQRRRHVCPHAADDYDEHGELLPLLLLPDQRRPGGGQGKHGNWISEPKDQNGEELNS